jgi:hypothetical protein
MYLQVHCASNGLDRPGADDGLKGSKQHPDTKARKVPAEARAAFPEMTTRLLKAHLAEGLIDRVIGKDNEKWLPQCVRDSQRS